eukprot:806869-Pyramimonas_sp.AAC.1
MDSVFLRPPSISLDIGTTGRLTNDKGETDYRISRWQDQPGGGQVRVMLAIRFTLRDQHRCIP